MTILGGPSWMDHKFALRSLWKQHSVEGWRVVIWDYEQSDVLFRVCFWLVAPLSLWKSSTFLLFLYAPGQDHLVLLVFSVKTWYSIEQLNTISKLKLYMRRSTTWSPLSIFLHCFVFCLSIYILHQSSRPSQRLGPLFQTIRRFPPGGICLTRFGSMLLRSIWYHRLRLASRRPSYRGFTLWFHASTSRDVDRRWCNTDSFLAIFCETKGE